MLFLSKSEGRNSTKVKKGACLGTLGGTQGATEKTESKGTGQYSLKGGIFFVVLCSCTKSAYKKSLLLLQQQREPEARTALARSRAFPMPPPPAFPLSR